MTAPPDPAGLHRALTALLAEASRDARLVPEIARARREFSGLPDPDPSGDPGRRAASDARFAEWYLLDRESELLGETPARSLLRGVGGPKAEYEMLLGSRVGVFVVESSTTGAAPADGLVRLRDLQDQRPHDMRAPESLRLDSGDVLVGRLFEDGHGCWVPSAAVAIQPAGAALAHAFARDVARLGLDRRLTQAEIEHLLFHRWSQVVAASESHVPLERLEAELQSVLDAAGKPEIDAATISNQLGGAEHSGAVAGPLLEEIAFDTDADLELVRRLLLQIWNERHAETPETPGPAEAARPAAPSLLTPEALPTEPAPEQTTEQATEPVPPAPPAEPAGSTPERAREAGNGGAAEEKTLGQRLARRIEEGMAQHEGVDSIFADVAHMMGDDTEGDALTQLPLHPETPDTDAPEAAESEGDPPLSVFDQGDLAALVQEFLWEEKCGDGPERDVLQTLLDEQEQAPVPRVDLEALEVADVLRFLFGRYLESPPTHRAERVRQGFAVLERFYAWAERTQEYGVLTTIEECRAAFLDDLDRVHAASLALSRHARTEPDDAPGPTLLRVDGCSADGLGVTVGGTEETLVLGVPTAGLDIREGDLVLAGVEPAGGQPAHLCGMVVVLPASAEPLLGG